MVGDFVLDQMVTNFFRPRMSGAEGRSRTDTGSPPPVFEDQRISDIHCAVITDLVEHNVPVPGLVDVLFITGTETDGVLGVSYPELQVR